MRHLIVTAGGPEDLGAYPKPQHVLHTLAETGKVLTPDGGNPITLLRNVLPVPLVEEAYRLWLPHVRDSVSNRANVLGTERDYGVLKNGSPGKRLKAPPSAREAARRAGIAQGVLGYLDRSGSEPCHEARLSEEHPELLAKARALIEMVSEVYARHAPEAFARQWAEVANLPRWRLWDTAFTTVYLVRGLRCAYHKDAGNLRGVRSCIMPMGNFSGGQLVFRSLGVAVAYQVGDLLLCDPQLSHGNLPFVGKRMSAVFYCEARIAQCPCQGRP